MTREKSKLPWFDNWRNEFKLNSCRTVEKYIKHHTGLSEVNVHKTERYLVINYTADGQMKTKKINLPAGVLYCLDEEDFKEFFGEFRKVEPNKNDEHNLYIAKNAKYPFKIEYKIEWPFEIKVQDMNYFRTGKTGTLVTGCPCAEYANKNDSRIWLDLEGNTQPD